MKILVLNIDRDDDFGRKAKIESPIIGIDNNINAANQLGQADPEDSDLNAIFLAISTYNKLKKENRDVEIATICGHMNVGIKSDEIIAKQLEKVIKETQTDEVILISDGAEDEYVIPIIQSRIKITSIKRVIVKQSQNLEDTYFRILKIFSDEKVLKHFILPIALVLIVWGIFVFLGMIQMGFAATLLTLGAYLLMRVFRWERNIYAIWDEIKSGFLTGKLSIFTGIIAIAIIIVTAFIAFDNYNNELYKPSEDWIPAFYYLKNMIWGFVIAGLLFVIGRVIDTYVTETKNPWRYWIAPFSLFAFGFITYAVSNALYSALKRWPTSFDTSYFTYLDFIIYICLGIFIAFVGGLTYHYIKDMHLTKEKEIEIEKQTSKMIEKN